MCCTSVVMFDKREGERGRNTDKGRLMTHCTASTVFFNRNNLKIIKTRTIDIKICMCTYTCTCKYF